MNIQGMNHIIQITIWVARGLAIGDKNFGFGHKIEASVHFGSESLDHVLCSTRTTEGARLRGESSSIT